MTQAEKLMQRAQETAERIAATQEGRQANKLSEGIPELEEITHLLFTNDY